MAGRWTARCSTSAPHATRTPPTGDAMGVLYLVATAVTVLGSVGAMLLRYRKVQG